MWGPPSARAVSNGVPWPQSLSPWLTPQTPNMNRERTFLRIWRTWRPAKAWHKATGFYWRVKWDIVMPCGRWAKSQTPYSQTMWFLYGQQWHSLWSAICNISCIRSCVTALMMEIAVNITSPPDFFQSVAARPVGPVVHKCGVICNIVPVWPPIDTYRWWSRYLLKF